MVCSVSLQYNAPIIHLHYPIISLKRSYNHQRVSIGMASSYT